MFIRLQDIGTKRGTQNNTLQCWLSAGDFMLKFLQLSPSSGSYDLLSLVNVRPMAMAGKSVA